jgi:hypothetical protein
MQKVAQLSQALQSVALESGFVERGSHDYMTALSHRVAQKIA